MTIPHEEAITVEPSYVIGRYIELSGAAYKIGFSNAQRTHFASQLAFLIEMLYQHGYRVVVTAHDEHGIPLAAYLEKNP